MKSNKIYLNTAVKNSIRYIIDTNPLFSGCFLLLHLFLPTSNIRWLCISQMVWSYGSLYLVFLYDLGKNELRTVRHLFFFKSCEYLPNYEIWKLVSIQSIVAGEKKGLAGYTNKNANQHFYLQEKFNWLWVKNLEFGSENKSFWLSIVILIHHCFYV